ncbi:hypothetical protein B0I27_101505 [Arcticibacter pallidicorallinus]|uniref:DUF4410 domain-containing protein n=1 Tax=Arcticibacter pallidicorallinus TaxID=1259464 RepID=A0A2T0UC84_9SPHI|nr:hypothetical protein [Arcticibacter pallidicorallinus]PRY55533.1 hypothetical protein B0I27_101505 [Arcticibacter pallidicorallinus]
MKKTLLLFVLISANLLAFGQYENAKQVFESPKLKTAVATHKVVAILPFGTKISFKKQPKDFDLEAHVQKERAMATSIQSSMYTFLLRKSSNYTVEFQDVEKTNVLLKKAGLIDKLDEVTKDEVAKALGVDAVISGKFETEQTRSEAGAIVTTVLFGGIGSKTGSGSLTMAVYNGQSGDMLWRFFKAMNDGVFSSSDELIDRMMRKVSRNFPYSK